MYRVIINMNTDSVEPSFDKLERDELLKQKRREYKRKWVEKNRQLVNERQLVYQKKYNDANKDLISAKKKLHYYTHHAEIRERQNTARKLKREQAKETATEKTATENQ